MHGVKHIGKSLAVHAGLSSANEITSRRAPHVVVKPGTGALAGVRIAVGNRAIRSGDQCESRCAAFFKLRFCHIRVDACPVLDPSACPMCV